ncbi:NAD(P)-dependent oxidoreductase [Gordonia sp. TBRC 11910]|uniref:NAD(P)-dependent oxidoreductase n=1 Tax=Gordonia asplenii TaxID=2725283 RepID=A0A848L7K8_9ACTN|nr:NAD(P)-dependent oxidoreductase [Gordonia asplenii]NMO03558.1 NAD(P)-dependent oxidoreductase [Gordonia asplenii]
MTATVGFVGTGAMGTAMVERLIDQGYDVVVHNRTRDHAQRVLDAGAHWSATPAGVAEAEIVLTCLRDTSAVRTTYLGPVGLLRSGRPGQIFVEHGTFAPAAAAEIAAQAQRGGAHFLAAPVSGGVEGARSGSLAIMVGGSREGYNTARNILAALSSEPTLVGGPTAGLGLKLVNQLLTSAHMAVAAEAAALVEDLDIELDLASGILRRSWGSSAMMERTFGLLDAGRTEDTGATVRGMREVLDLVADLVRDKGIDAAVFDAGRSRFAAADADGLGAADPAALVRLARAVR